MVRKLVPVTAALLLFAACASDDDALRVDTAAPAAAVLQASETATDAGSAHVELSMVMSGPGAGEKVEITGGGDYDTTARQASMELDFGSLLSAVGATGAEVPEGLDRPMRMVLDGDTMYLSVPGLTQASGGRPWLSVPVDQASGSALGGFGVVGAGSDPAAVLDYLRGAGEVTEEGHAEIDGVDTTKYAVSVDLAKALDEVPAAQRQQLQAQLDAMGQQVRDIPMAVWIDGDGLPRRVEMTIDLPRVGTVTMTMTWSKYGEPVSIEVPDPSEVSPAAGALG